MPAFTVAEGWRSFRAAVIADVASSAQLDDCRFSFYGGAHWIVGVLLREPAKSEQQPEAFMTEICRRLFALRDELERSKYDETHSGEGTEA